MISHKATDTALILFSHGSLLCGAGETLRSHAERLRARGEYLTVEIGYLNYSEPPFEEAAAKCAQAGARRVVVVPYFLVAGKFVTTDLPPRVDAARKRWPEIEFILARPIGFSERIADALLEVAGRALPPERWRDDLHNASNFCEARETCPLYATDHCPRTFARESVS